MSAFLASLRSPFVARVGAGRARAWLAYRAPRTPLALVLALLPGVALVLLASLAPRAADEDRVVAVLSRAIGGLITAATIAVGFGTLALRRGIQGIGELDEHVRADETFRARARELTGDDALPLAVGPFLAGVHGALAAQAQACAQGASAAERASGWQGAALGEYLATVAARAEATAQALREAGPAPQRALAAALDFDHDVAAHLAAGHRRAEGLGEATRERLGRIEALLDVSRIATAYLKSLDTQWSISQMSRGIATSSFAAVFGCAYVALAYRGPQDLAWAAAALVLLALPLAIFVSHAVRFVFVHQHSLPLGGFTLGPENPRLRD